MADSMIIIVLFIGTLFFGIADICGTQGVNAVIDISNGFISNGNIDSYSGQAISWTVEMWKFAPFAYIIGLLAFCYERAKGTDFPANIFFNYEALLIGSLFVSTVLAVVFGYLVNITFDTLYSVDIIGNIPEHWDNYYIIKIVKMLVALVCMIPAFVGSILFMIHPIIKQTDTSWFDIGESDAVAQDQQQIQYNDQQFL